MAKGEKTGGRVKGTSNKLTKEIRVVLKKIITELIENIPELLKDLEPKEQLEITTKLMPYVLPKVRDISHDNNELLDFTIQL